MSKSFISILVTLIFAHVALLFVSLVIDSSSENVVQKKFAVQLGEMKTQAIQKIVKLKNKTLPSNPPQLSEDTISRPVHETSEQSTGEIETEKETYRRELREKIEENKYYPTMSQRLGQSGVVTVSFVVHENGEISDVKLETPCAFERLNQAAVEAVLKVVKFKPIPKVFGQDRIELRVPLKFIIL